MQPPPHLLDDADLLAFAEVPSTARFTGRLNLYTDGERIGAVPCLAICKPRYGVGLMLLHCDEQWEIFGLQAWNAPGVEPITTVEAMKLEAERLYEGLMASWIDLSHMVEASAFFDESQNLTSIFGTWPSLHDAEITDVHLWRGDVKAGEWDDSNVFPVLTVTIRILEDTQPHAVGDSARDVLAKLRFYDVDDLRIEGFNHQNEILGISIAARDRGKYVTGEKLPPDFRVIFERGFGMAASFRCSRAEVVEAKRV